ncbi:unnamed protein product [Bursaphelenchus okinawaensis]|uniref:Uncharacterized protein n=1 Tax=Bursaphelenchus okinawaensis TaxID=465554 RepID=A0A811L5M2_9BILA|nr:unnamed protein product [Bursaphelenchus okinawaensis]CAG9117094.1 unnamed protein product [Bursaphelenchus okinawaensis]
MWIRFVVILLILQVFSGQAQKSCYNCLGFQDPNAPHGDGKITFDTNCAVVDADTRVTKTCNGDCVSKIGMFRYMEHDFKIFFRGCEKILKGCKDTIIKYRKLKAYGCTCDGSMCNSIILDFPNTTTPTATPTTKLSTTTEFTTTSTDLTTTTPLPTTTSDVVVSTTSGQDSTVTAFDNTTVDSNTTLPIQSTTDWSIATTTDGDTTSFTKVTTDQTGTFSTVPGWTSESSTINPVSTAPALFPTDWSILLTTLIWNYIWFWLL